MVPAARVVERPGRLRAALLALAGLVMLPVPASAQLPDPAAEPITPIPYASPDRDAMAHAALGAALFADPRLSSDGRVACASCHDLASNGASALSHDPAPDGHRTALNTITVFNAGLNFRQDWRGDARTQADQADIALKRPDIMNASPAQVLAALRAEPGMTDRFRSVFGHGPDWRSLLDCLAAFEATLTTPDSRFDLWLKGDRSALTAAELDGYHIFKSIGCVACHQGVNIGGNLFEKVGVARNDLPDSGKIFRVPSLRNVAMTAPYFHDGSAPTLRVAVHRMASGQLGLALTDQEVTSIIAFLQTLTGRYDGQSVSRPR